MTSAQLKELKPLIMKGVLPRLFPGALVEDAPLDHPRHLSKRVGTDFDNLVCRNYDTRAADQAELKEASLTATPPPGAERRGN